MELRRLPIIKLYRRLLVAMQGEITDEVADQITQEVLQTIRDEGPVGLVIDLTGVWVMDSHLCATLSNLTASAKLMGTPTVISGLSPEIAMTLQTMGMDLDGVHAALSLEHALSLLGLDVREAVRDPEDSGDPFAQEDEKSRVTPPVFGRLRG